MSDQYRPTCYLRFQERAQTDLFESIQGRTRLKILQQLWTSNLVGEPDEWRDVPIAAESTGKST